MSKRWIVTGTVVGSIYLGEFEADTKEQAEEMALESAHVGMCHQCSYLCEDPEVTSAEASEAHNVQ